MKTTALFALLLSCACTDPIGETAEPDGGMGGEGGIGAGGEGGIGAGGEGGIGAGGEGGIGAGGEGGGVGGEGGAPAGYKLVFGAAHLGAGQSVDARHTLTAGVSSGAVLSTNNRSRLVAIIAD